MAIRSISSCQGSCLRVILLQRRQAGVRSALWSWSSIGRTVLLCFAGDPRAPASAAALGLGDLRALHVELSCNPPSARHYAALIPFTSRNRTPTCPSRRSASTPRYAQTPALNTQLVPFLQVRRKPQESSMSPLQYASPLPVVRLLVDRQRLRQFLPNFFSTSLCGLNSGFGSKSNPKRPWPRKSFASRIHELACAQKYIRSPGYIFFGWSSLLLGLFLCGFLLDLALLAAPTVFCVFSFSFFCSSALRACRLFSPAS